MNEGINPNAEPPASVAAAKAGAQAAKRASVKKAAPAPSVPAPKVQNAPSTSVPPAVPVVEQKSFLRRLADDLNEEYGFGSPS